MKHFRLSTCIAIALCTVTSVFAQRPPGVYQQPLAPGMVAPTRVQDYSWIGLEPIPPRKIALHDIVTIIVDDKSEVTVQSNFQRQSVNTFQSALNEFVRLGESGNLENAAANSPTIDTSTTNRIQGRAQLADREGVRYRIAATVADILPNGNVVLEARKSVTSNDDTWQYTLTGTIRSVDISANNTALSDNIANLHIGRQTSGKIADTTKRRWGTALLDLMWPF